jgi:hypothetical protein
MSKRLFSEGAPRGAIDVASIPRGFAILYSAGRGAKTRFIDLYDVNGTYEQSMNVPSSVFRIAGSDYRIYALETKHDSIALSSYILPESLWVSQR